MGEVIPLDFVSSTKEISIESSMLIFKKTKTIEINSALEPIKQLKLYDCSGKVIYASYLSEKNVSLSLEKIQKGTLIVEVVNAKSESKSLKFTNI
ncbi:MAG: hypothetical protein QM800_01070 [Paludibacter sp.]